MLSPRLFSETTLTSTLLFIFWPLAVLGFLLKPAFATLLSSWPGGVIVALFRLLEDCGVFSKLAPFGLMGAWWTMATTEKPALALALDAALGAVAESNELNVERETALAGDDSAIKWGNWCVSAGSISSSRGLSGSSKGFVLNARCDSNSARFSKLALQWLLLCPGCLQNQHTNCSARTFRASAATGHSRAMWPRWLQVKQWPGLKRRILNLSPLNITRCVPQSLVKLSASAFRQSWRTSTISLRIFHFWQ